MSYRTEQFENWEHVTPRQARVAVSGSEDMLGRRLTDDEVYAVIERADDTMRDAKLMGLVFRGKAALVPVAYRHADGQVQTGVDICPIQKREDLVHAARVAGQYRAIAATI